MEAPNVIFVDDLAVVNDSVTKISIHSLPNFSEYIRKDTLLEWAKEKANDYKGTANIRRSFELMIKKIESL
jgi:hypothetical protein